jgi:ABC-type Fe3+ transport system substrate-binding protein
LRRGEVPLAITYVIYALTYAQKGAPVDYVRLGKMMGDGHYALLSNKSPHPDAGKAFIDYLLGEESMRILARMGEFVNRKGISPPRSLMQIRSNLFRWMTSKNTATREKNFKSFSPISAEIPIALFGLPL